MFIPDPDMDLGIQIPACEGNKYDFAGKAASYKTIVMDPDRSDPETFKSLAGALNWNFCPVGIVLRVVSGYGINHYSQFTHFRKLRYLGMVLNIP
jgi:hypothetical protein